MSDLADRISQLSPKRLALLALELDDRLEAAERDRREPIAVIGMACRFPGDATTPERYWDVLRDGVDAITEVPPDRWDVDALFDPNPDTPGQMSTRWAGCHGGWDQFDPRFFGISPREAQSHGSAAARVARSRVGSDRAGGHGARSSCTGQRPACSSASATPTTSSCSCAGMPRAIDAYFASGNAFSVACRPLVVSARPAGAERLDRYGLLVVAGGGPPRVPEPARARVPHGARRRRELHRRAAGDDLPCRRRT